MSDDEPAIEPRGELLRLDLPPDRLELSISKRRLGLRIAPYGVIADSRYGPLMFEPGAFGDVVPPSVKLRMDHVDPPTGKGAMFDDRPDGAYMEFAVSQTTRGNDQLELAKDGTSTGASVGFRENGNSVIKKIGGRNVRVYPPNSASLEEVSTTWQPTFKEAGVMYVLKQGEPVSDPIVDTSTPAPDPRIDAILQKLDRDASDRPLAEKLDLMLSKFGDMSERMEEAQRQAITVPAGEPPKKAALHQWVEVTLMGMAGKKYTDAELKFLALDDVKTSEQPGLVPDVFTADYDDLINTDRPFLNSTRELAPPRTGNSMTLPIITARAEAGTQSGGEKGDLTTVATKVGTGTFNYESVFGGADISVQMILRADASFFDLLTGDIAMAYALDCEAKAIDALLSGYTDSGSVGHNPNDGGALDPENLLLGEAWQTSIQSTYRRGPTHIWLSSAAVARFIDAKAPLTNAPLYSTLAADITAGGGVGGRLSGLIPIYVPALDDTEGVDVIVGPGRGFNWAEDPALRLQADVPSKAGRDIVLAGGIFPAPRFADAFTTFTIAS